VARYVRTDTAIRGSAPVSERMTARSQCRTSEATRRSDRSISINATCFAKGRPVPPAYRVSRHGVTGPPRQTPRGVGEATKLNEFRWQDGSGSLCQTTAFADRQLCNRLFQIPCRWVTTEPDRPRPPLRPPAPPPFPPASTAGRHNCDLAIHS